MPTSVSMSKAQPLVCIKCFAVKFIELLSQNNTKGKRNAAITAIIIVMADE